LVSLRYMGINVISDAELSVFPGLTVTASICLLHQRSYCACAPYVGSLLSLGPHRCYLALSVSSFIAPPSPRCSHSSPQWPSFTFTFCFFPPHVSPFYPVVPLFIMYFPGSVFRWFPFYFPHFPLLFIRVFILPSLPKPGFKMNALLSGARILSVVQFRTTRKYFRHR
jgi:hypothetical protein